MSVDDAVDLGSPRRGRDAELYRWLRISPEQAAAERERALRAAKQTLAPVLDRVAVPFDAWASKAIELSPPSHESLLTIVLTPVGARVARNGIATVELRGSSYHVGATWCGTWVVVAYVGQDDAAAARAVDLLLLRDLQPTCADTPGATEARPEHCIAEMVAFAVPQEASR
jgi:hypothetical protein